MDPKTGTKNIEVAIRIRPLIQSERGKKSHWNTQDTIIYQIDESGQKYGEVYSFDHIFGMNKTNSEIYSNVVKEFVMSSLDGLNSTIFAYGQTSSGKTYTMLGDKKEPGIISLAVENIFNEINNNSCRKFLIRVSYIEIYNEKINDLLDPSNKDVKVREFYPATVSLQNVKEEIISNKEEIFECIRVGNMNRHIGLTKANDNSSRSHTIFKIMIESTQITDFDSKTGSVQVSNLNLVDLAGSERVAQTKATGIRLKEGGHINKSLSALGLVIKQLSEGKEFVNFRDSKLTRLLQDSLGGNSKTLIITTITVASVDDTASTLAFAQRAKTVKNKPHVNEILTDADVGKRYESLNSQLKHKLDQQLIINEDLQKTQEENIRKMSKLQQQMDMLAYFQKGGRKNVDSDIPKRRHTIGFTHHKKNFDSRSANNTSIDGILLQEKPEPLINGSCDVTRSERFLAPINEEESIDTPLKPRQVDENLNINTTPVNRLKLRLSSLERDYNELVQFTRHEDNIFNETAVKLDLLEKKLDETQKELEEYKSREQISEDSPIKLSEIEDLMNQLLSLKQVLSCDTTIMHIGDNSVIHTIAKFNVKVKTARDTIENEILKEINSRHLLNESINCNDFESFNELLTELEQFESEIPVDLINNMKTDCLQDLKILIKIYQSLLRKNDVIDQYSEKLRTVEEGSKYQSSGFEECDISNESSLFEQTLNNQTELLSEVEELRLKVKNFESEVEELKRSNSELITCKEDNERLKQEIDELLSFHGGTRKLSNELENKIKCLEETNIMLQSISADRDLLSLNLEELTRNHERLIQENVQFKIDLGNFKDGDLAKMQEKYDDLNSHFNQLQLEHLQCQNEQPRDVIKAEIEDLHEMKLKNIDKENALLNLQNKCLKYEEDISKYIKDTQDLRNVNQKILEKQAGVNEANKKLECSLETFKTEIDKLKSETDVKRKESEELNNKLFNCQQKLSELEGMYKSSKKQIKIWEKEHENNLNIINDLQDEMKQQKNIINKLEQQDKISEVEELNNELQLLNTQLSEKEGLVKEMNNKCVQFEEQISKLTKVNEDLRNVNCEILEKQADIKVTNQELEDSAKAFKSDIEILKREIEETLKEKEELKNKLSSWEDENLQQESEQINRLQSLNDEKTNQILELEKLIENTKNKIRMCESEQDSTKKSLGDLQSEIKQQKDIINRLENENLEAKNVKQELESLQIEISEKVKQLNELNEKCDEFEATNSNLTKENENLKNMNCEILEEIAKIEAAKQGFEDSVNSLKSEIETLEVKEVNLNKEIVSLRRELEEAHKLNGRTELKLERQKFLCDTSQEQIKNIKLQAAECEKFKRELTDIKGILMCKNHEISELVSKNEMLTAQFAELQERIKEPVKVEDCDKSKFVEMLCAIIRHTVSELKIILLTKHSQNERNYLKDVLKDIRSSNVLLNSDEYAMKNNQFDLSGIGNHLIKAISVFKEYFQFGKKFLEVEIQNLSKSKEEYIQEIMVLKDRQESECSTCNNFKTRCSDLEKANKKLEKRVQEIRAESLQYINEITTLRTKLYQEQDRKAEIQYTEMMKFYRDNDIEQREQIRILQQKLEQNKKLNTANKEYEEFKRNYQMIEAACNKIKMENKTLKAENLSLKSLSAKMTVPMKKDVEVQCYIVCAEKPPTRDVETQWNSIREPSQMYENYDKMKAVCYKRKKKIAELEAENLALKSARN